MDDRFIYLDPDDRYTCVFLVQRLEARKYGADRHKGIDRFFSMDYMGSSEFEWGALPKALKEMRAKDFEKHKPVLIKVTAEEVEGANERAKGHKPFKGYYLGPPEWVPFIREFFTRELRDNHSVALKESTFIAGAYGVSEYDRLGERVVGWWDITNHWCLFKTEKHANQFLEGLKSKDKAA